MTFMALRIWKEVFLLDSIGKRFRYLRKYKGLNQIDFASAIGVSQGTLSDIENDRCKPSVETIISAIGYFKINADWLLIGKGGGPDDHQESSSINKDHIENQITDNDQPIATDGIIEDKPPAIKVYDEVVSEDEKELLGLYRKLDDDYNAKTEIHMYIKMKLDMQHKTKKGLSSTYVNGEEAAAKIDA